MSIATTFASGNGNSYTINQTGGKDNFNFTINYGGYKSSVSYESDLKNGYYSNVPREETCEKLVTNILTDRSDFINGIYQNTANVSVEMVGDKYYQDAEEANAFLESMNAHNAQVSSSGHNDFGFDVSSLTSNVMPIDLKSIVSNLSSVTATPDNLLPVPPADSIWNLPTTLKVSLANQATIEAETLSKQLEMLPKAQMEMGQLQTESALAELSEDGGEDNDVMSSIMSMSSSFFGGGLSPVTQFKDSYGIDGDVMFDGLSDYINNGGIEAELRI